MGVFLLHFSDTTSTRLYLCTRYCKRHVVTTHFCYILFYCIWCTLSSIGRHQLCIPQNINNCICSWRYYAVLKHLKCNYLVKDGLVFITVQTATWKICFKNVFLNRFFSCTFTQENTFFFFYLQMALNLLPSHITSNKTD